MPTIVDQLLVTLGLDSKSFDKERAKVDKGLKDTGKTGDEAFKKMAKSATEFFAIVGGTYEIKRFIQGQIEANAALEQFSQNLNENANSISQWSNAVELAGGSARGLEGTLDMLSKAQTDVQLTGQSALLPYLNFLKLSLTDAQGHALPVTKLLENALNSLSKLGDRRTAFNIGQRMGIDAGTLNMALMGDKALQQLIKRVKEHAAVTDAQATESLKLNVTMNAVTQNFTAFGRELLQDASPALEKIYDILYKVGDWMRENRQLVSTFLEVVAAGLTAISVAAIGINATAVALLAFGAAIALAWNDYKVWKEGGDSLFNWGPAIDVATAAFRVLKNVLEDVLYRLAHVGAAIAFIAHGDFADAKAVAGGILTGKPGPSGDDARNQFIAAAASKLGVPASAIDAQLRLETGATGSKAIGSYNYGNIKAGAGYSGATVAKDVKEYTSSGQAYTARANFRSYATPREAADDFASMIVRKFPGAVGAKDAAGFARGLQAGGYATDPSYVSKIASIASGIAGASGAAQGASASSRLAAAPVGGNRSVETHIGEVNVHTAATDADGIAKDMGKSLNYLFTAQANYGLR